MQAEDFAVLGSILERQGQASAVTVLERAAALDPGHAEALSGLARLHAREGRLPEAIDAARKLTSRPGWESRGSLILGVLDAEDADPEAAAEALDRALLADPALAGGITSHVSSPEPGDPDAPLGRPMSAGAEAKCVACHVTSLRAARDRRAPEAADREIGCERCHGPGGNHRIAIKLAGPNPAIARPSRASAAQINRLCGARRLADDPSTRETDPRFVRFQATTFPLSRCYAEGPGTLSCMTCHDPHRDAETDPAAYERRCLACHAADKGSKTPLIGATAGRTVACPVNPASGCIGCHMPKIAGAAPHALFTDHQIRVHSPTPRPGG